MINKIMSFLKRWWSGEMYREAYMKARKNRARTMLEMHGINPEEFARMDPLQRARIARDVASYD